MLSGVLFLEAFLSRSARSKRLLNNTRTGIRTQDHIRLDSSFHQELSIVEIAFDSIDVRVQCLQPLGRRMFSHERGDCKLWVSFGDRVKKSTANTASGTGPAMFLERRGLDFSCSLLTGKA